MKKSKLFGLAFAALLSFGTILSNAQSLSPSTKRHYTGCAQQGCCQGKGYGGKDHETATEGGRAASAQPNETNAPTASTFIEHRKKLHHITAYSEKIS